MQYKNMTKSKCARMIILFLLLIYVAYNTLFLIADKFVGGGRWGVSMFVEMARRFLKGQGLFYSNASTGFLTSPFYFPGGTFLAILIQLVFKQYSEEIMIVAACVMGIAAIFLFVRIAGDGKKDYLIPALVIFPLFFNGFVSLKGYLSEMHPDMPVLLFGAISAIEIEKISKKDYKKWTNYLILIISLFCCGVFKQNSIMLYLGFALSILISKFIPSNKKIKLLGAIAISGVFVLLVIFGIDGCFEATVRVMSRHKSVSLETYIGYIKNSVKYNKIFVSFFIFFLALLFTKNIKMTFLQKMWFLSSIIWAAFNLYGTKKEGSNEGNVDVALIVFAPFVGIAITEVLYKIKDCIHFDKNFSSEWNKKFFLSIISVFCCILLIFSPARRFFKQTKKSISRDKKQYLVRKSNEKIVTNWLNTNYKGASVAIYSHYYYWICKADINISTDFYTENAYAMAGMDSNKDIEKLYNNFKWDLIIFHNTEYSIPPSEWNFAKYELIKNEPISDIISMDVYARVE